MVDQPVPNTEAPAPVIVETKQPASPPAAGWAASDALMVYIEKWPVWMLIRLFAGSMLSISTGI